MFFEGLGMSSLGARVLNEWPSVYRWREHNLGLSSELRDPSSGMQREWHKSVRTQGRQYQCPVMVRSILYERRSSCNGNGAKGMRHHWQFHANNFGGV